MSVKINITPVQDLFNSDVAIPPGLLKDAVIKNFKESELIGVPDTELRISFDNQDGNDILIRRIDPENALGYSVYESEEDYFDHLQAELYEPSQEEILEALSE